MKNIILILFIFVALQSAIAQQKKKVIAKTAPAAVVKKAPVSKKVATSKVSTTEKAASKEAPAQKEIAKKAAPTEKITNNQTSSQKAASQKASAQKSNVAVAYSKEDFQLNAGIGVSGWGVPVYVGADYFVDNDISIGAEVSYQTFNETIFVQKYKSSILGIGVNGNYHFRRVLKLPNEWDLYAGIGIGYYIWSFDNVNYAGSNTSGTGFGGQIGARYFINNKFAINAELGGASTTSGARIGITYKL